MADSVCRVLLLSSLIHAARSSWQDNLGGQRLGSTMKLLKRDACISLQTLRPEMAADTTQNLAVKPTWRGARHKLSLLSCA